MVLGGREGVVRRKTVSDRSRQFSRRENQVVSSDRRNGAHLLCAVVPSVVTSWLVATEESSLTNFGLLIAYVLPGFTALEGFPLVTPFPRAWGTGGDPNPNLTAFLSGTVMAIAAGLTVSAVRWLCIDTIHRMTGLRRPVRDFMRLERSVAAAEYLDLVHYRYYKFYANMVVALVYAYATRDYALGPRGLLDWLLVVLFFFASRDTLAKFYERSGRLLAPPPSPAPEPEDEFE